MSVRLSELGSVELVVVEIREIDRVLVAIASENEDNKINIYKKRTSVRSIHHLRS